MPPSNAELHERFIDLAWSLWTGLGVAGQIDNHGDCAIDPEPLIIYTAGLRDADPRLRDELTDWCIRYGQLVSGSRLKNLLALESDGVKTGFGELAATVAENSSLRWPGATTARKHQHRARKKIGAFTRSSQVILRLRALMGVTARSDIIATFLGSPRSAFSAADLAAQINYSKRNVALALDMLVLGNILESFSIRNQIRFRIPSYSVKGFGEILSGLSGANVPQKFPRLSPRLRVLSRIRELLIRSEKLTQKVRAVEAVSVLNDSAVDLRDAGFPSPPIASQSRDFWSDFTNWCFEISK